MALDISKVVPIYQSNIDLIIQNLGKAVVLYFEPLVTNIGTNWDDPLRHSDPRKPSFKQESGSDPAPTITINNKTIKALVQDNPKEFQNFGIRVDKPNAIIRLKTFLTDVPDLKRCKYIVPHADARDVIEAKYRLIMEPIPKGLQVDRYAVSYWEHV